MEIATTECEGHELAYGVQGRGAPVVLVPGHTMSIQRWINTGYVDRLARSRMVVAVDPLGHGRSSHSSDPNDYTPDKLIEHLMAVLDALDLDTVDVWGYSRGALVATLAANAHPERFGTVVYGGNTLFDPHDILESMGLIPDDATLDARHQRALDGDWQAYWEGFPLPLPEATKRTIEADNHLPSISASGIAGTRHRLAFRHPQNVDLFAYWGSDEIFHQLNLDAAAELGIDHGAVPGGHAQAFDPSTHALDLVEPRLATT